MIKSTYSFTIGQFTCVAISDGTHTYPDPVNLLFPTANREKLHQALLQHGLHHEEWKEFKNTYTCLLIDTGTALVLVDTGTGESLGDASGKLLQNLKSLGILPAEIDWVILSHGHPDHIGGNTTRNGEAVFSNARYLMFKDEWNFWNTDQGKREMENRGFHPELQKGLLAIAKMKLRLNEGQLELIDQDREIIPGIQVLKAPGHTPGHMILRIESNDERLYCFSDLFIHPIHLEYPEWCTAVDINHEQMENTRRDLLHRAEKENAWIQAFHFPFPGLGTIKKKDSGWQWMPANQDS